jgi:intein-encoded DNA endonuclease-like protein
MREKYEKQVTLADGRVVGSWSEEWRNECEAATLLRMPLHKRRQYLEEVSKKRHPELVQKLKDSMSLIHAAKKSKSVA